MSGVNGKYVQIYLYIWLMQCIDFTPAITNYKFSNQYVHGMIIYHILCKLFQYSWCCWLLLKLLCFFFLHAHALESFLSIDFMDCVLDVVDFYGVEYYYGCLNDNILYDQEDLRNTQIENK